MKRLPQFNLWAAHASDTGEKLVELQCLNDIPFRAR